MKYELLALMPGMHTVPFEAGLVTVASSGFTAVFQPASPAQLLGQALRRTRLMAASKRQARLERLMEHGTVLPFAPASVFDPRDTDALVASNFETFTALVGRLENRVQYQVSVTWTEDRVLEKFRDTPEIEPLFAAPSVSGAAVSSAVSKLADRLAQTINSQLALVASDFSELPRDRHLIANTVVLIAHSAEAALENVIGEIDAIWPEGFRIRQIGPGPAVSFATLNLQRFGKKDIARAHRVLELTGQISGPGIRDARQRLLRDPSVAVSEVRMAARIALAAQKSGRPERPVHLVDLWSEGRATAHELEHVA